MSGYPTMAESQAGEPHPRLRVAALTAVIAGVVLVAGAAFVLSYQGIHQIALNAGVSHGLARLYPVMLDATLVMACAAALALRTAGLWIRSYVWACLIVLLAAVAAGNALYAMNISLPAQPARAVIAVLPWALLLMGFGMLLAMLRHWRRIRAASAAAEPARLAGPGDSVAPGAAAGGGSGSGAGSPGNGPAKAGASRSGIRELMEPRQGQPPERAGLAATGAAGSRATIASGESAEGKRPGPAATANDAGDGTGAAAGPAHASGALGSTQPAAPAGTPGTAPAPPSGPGAGPRPQAATVPFLDRILGGPTHPNAPEADGE